MAELLLVDRAEVLRRSATLASERRALRLSGLQWERCAVYLYDRMPKDPNKPEKPPSPERFLEDGEELSTLLRYDVLAHCLSFRHAKAVLFRDSDYVAYLFGELCCDLLR